MIKVENMNDLDIRFNEEVFNTFKVLDEEYIKILLSELDEDDFNNNKEMLELFTGATKIFFRNEKIVYDFLKKAPTFRIMKAYEDVEFEGDILIFSYNLAKKVLHDWCEEEAEIVIKNIERRI